MASTNRTGTTARYVTPVGTGAVAAFLLVAVGGSPAYVGWAGDHTDEASAGGWVLRLLTWPAWSSDPDVPGGLFGANLRAVLLVLFTAGLLYLLPAAQAARVPGSASQFFTGWAGYSLAGGLASLVASPVASDSSLLTVVQSGGGGASYGFLFGWIVGAASLGGRA
ncbi:hypothetical protein QTQ03_17245 [Micromonospora sp. WMMA1363]|uniref:hypothetical protein n=1 Tax=Micromonospora sp. WMMA1363 TaxID=3053985 RepID=UPI00259D26AE|nr:hypothetical protein [Micromonospora sp. WMMA1363]MDM4721263.1 hypothetical protein [Micromonospora sp. WMMA1363]